MKPISHAAITVTKPGGFKLSKVNTQATGAFSNEEEAKLKISRDIAKLADLQERLFAEGKKGLLIIFQGMDTSGKDSTIKHVMTGLNPQGCKVTSFKRPSEEENRHDYLRRHSLALPGVGNIGIFNRSYYEEVTTVRVHGDFKNRKIWNQRFEEICAFEKYLTHNNYVIRKVFLHISEEEQRQRLLRRIDDPNKHWKFDWSDVTEREYWREYQIAYEEAIANTASAFAPWIVIPADHKWCARMAMSHVLVETLESLRPRYPTSTAENATKLRRARKLLLKK